LFSNQIFIGKRTVMWGKCTSFWLLPNILANVSWTLG
jgi:hypothetical protein